MDPETAQSQRARTPSGDAPESPLAQATASTAQVIERTDHLWRVQFATSEEAFAAAERFVLHMDPRNGPLGTLDDYPHGFAEFSPVNACGDRVRITGGGDRDLLFTNRASIPLRAETVQWLVEQNWSVR